MVFNNIILIFNTFLITHISMPSILMSIFISHDLMILYSVNIHPISQNFISLLYNLHSFYMINLSNNLSTYLIDMKHHILQQLNIIHAQTILFPIYMIHYYVIHFLFTYTIQLSHHDLMNRIITLYSNYSINSYMTTHILYYIYEQYLLLYNLKL